MAKEWRELNSSWAWWVFLFAMGPLVGASFISAVRIYGEASGLNGTAAGVGEAFSPLVGIWAPTLSACEIAAVFLLPFVVIRLVSGDKVSGAAKIELQHPISSLNRIFAKLLVLLAGWMLASSAVVIAIFLWRSYGGSIYVPELATVILGHLLNAMLTIGIAAALAAIAENPSTAAIVTLAITVGSWIVTFIAAVHGGIWERIAGFTPTAMVARFQRGLVRSDLILVALTLMVFTVVLASVWMQTGVPAKRRALETGLLSLIAAAMIFTSSYATPSWDLSENRMNSFSRADEATLRQIHTPLNIVVHLAPEDPRRVDLERQSLSKLRRTLHNLHVNYESATSIGLFEQTNPHYGEIWYEAGDKKSVSRAVTSEAVLENVYAVTGTAQPSDPEEPFRGHPLPVAPRGAAWIFYAVWPVVIGILGWWVNRRNS